MKILLIANGHINSYHETKELIHNYDYLIAVDGGLLHCQIMDLKPDRIIGDFDSITEDILANYPDTIKDKYPKDKDKSDLEIAIETAIALGATSIDIFGALGGRVDHFIYNLHLLTRYSIKIQLINEEEILFLLPKTATVFCEKGQTLSLIPLNNVKNLSTKNLKWDLKEAQFSTDHMSLSNICLDSSFSIQYESGHLILNLIRL